MVKAYNSCKKNWEKAKAVKTIDSSRKHTNRKKKYGITRFCWCLGSWWCSKAWIIRAKEIIQLWRGVRYTHIYNKRIDLNWTKMMMQEVDLMDTSKKQLASRIIKRLPLKSSPNQRWRVTLIWCILKCECWKDCLTPTLLDSMIGLNLGKDAICDILNPKALSDGLVIAAKSSI